MTQAYHNSKSKIDPSMNPFMNQQLVQEDLPAQDAVMQFEPVKPTEIKPVVQVQPRPVEVRQVEMKPAEVSKPAAPESRPIEPAKVHEIQKQQSGLFDAQVKNDSVQAMVDRLNDQGKDQTYAKP